jgi:hypothetical protein
MMKRRNKRTIPKKMMVAWIFMKQPPTTVVRRMLAKDEVDKTESSRCLYLACLVTCCIVIAGIILGIGFGPGEQRQLGWRWWLGCSRVGSDRDVEPTNSTRNGENNSGSANETPLTPELATVT